MKKSVLGLAAAMMTAVMCVGLVGCGGDAAGIKGKEVTEKQWNSALEYFTKEGSAYTIHLDGEQTTKTACVYLDEKLSGGQTQTYELEVTQNGALAHLKTAQKVEISGDMKKIAAAMDSEITLTDETEEAFAHLADGTCTIYTQNDDDKWVTTAGSLSELSLPFDEITSLLSLSFGSYEYSATLKGYVIKDALKKGAPYVVKFNGDGQLRAIYYADEETSKTDILTNTTRTKINVVIDYGEKKITLPTVG